MGGLARAVVCPGIGQIGCREGWPEFEVLQSPDHLEYCSFWDLPGLGCLSADVVL